MIPSREQFLARLVERAYRNEVNPPHLPARFFAQRLTAYGLLMFGTVFGIGRP
ncbi:hypothetical protein FRUB_08273 [Fimbriiglobus ruber]|uniref:Uncharacterized protein n=1 Tax=Fimbriiglobus ruber TaxID=1908690 RepID=A0A225D285_9BACT|nr:hypothetical protein FRUB_08273 [Fimbriiglobus ruber]